jgi:hypothetical protein
MRSVVQNTALLPVPINKTRIKMTEGEVYYATAQRLSRGWRLSITKPKRLSVEGMDLEELKDDLADEICGCIGDGEAVIEVANEPATANAYVRLLANESVVCRNGPMDYSTVDIVVGAARASDQGPLSRFNYRELRAPILPVLTFPFGRFCLSPAAWPAFSNWRATLVSFGQLSSGQGIWRTTGDHRDW